MAAEVGYQDVRVQESLRVRIGEAKNIPVASFSGSARNTCCAIKIDSEEIFRTDTVEKSTHPFFAAEFQGEIPKKFRYLSFYMHEVGNKNKVLGKVSLKKEELYKYHQKEHWFPLTYQDGDTEILGKVHVELKMEEHLTPSSDVSHKWSVRLIECSDLTVINGSCNPYAVVSLSYGKPKLKETRKTSVKKKTICPQFGETFYFSIDNKLQSHEKSSYVLGDFMTAELSISIFHDDSKVSREVLGNIFKGTFLGEVKIAIKDIDFYYPHNAWYCLQAKEQSKTNHLSLGSIRLRISYTAEYVFPSKYYDGLRQLILNSVDTKPFTSSTVFVLGEIVNHRESIDRENAAQPLVKLFLHHGKLIPAINALACWEMSTSTDPNTLFRGNSLLTKMVDELMKIIGLPYLQDTLKSFVHKVINYPRPCEIDPGRLKDGEDLETNMTNLYNYVTEALNIIVGSGLICPPVMRDVFCTLKSQAKLKYQNDISVRYHAVTSFIFLRFFTAAIMGPNLFDLHSSTPELAIQRTFTLISKGISGLVSLVSSKSNTVASKEEYMVPLFEMFPHSVQADIKMFLDIISSSTGSHVKVIEAPILLKEGVLMKRAQGRKRFGRTNFQKRFFRLSNQSLSYSKNKGDKHALFEIPITDILAVERLEEESFNMKYMFQVVYTERALYIQASNCVEEKEWLYNLTKICKSNQNRLKLYHPAAYINNHWLCCKSTDLSISGCKPVTGGLPLDDILEDTDSDREVEKIHSLLLSAMDMLDDLLEACGSQAVYSGENDAACPGLGFDIEDPSSCFATITELQNCVVTLEQEHLQYMHFLQSRTVIGSVDAPFGDETNTALVRNINRSSERLSHHGSRSSNASNMSRHSLRRSCSRGGSFQERGLKNIRGGNEGKSVSTDVSAVRQNKDAISTSHSVSDSGEWGVERARAESGDSGIGTDVNSDISNHGGSIVFSESKLDINGGAVAGTVCDDSGISTDSTIAAAGEHNDSLILTEASAGHYNSITVPEIGADRDIKSGTTDTTKLLGEEHCDNNTLYTSDASRDTEDNVSDNNNKLSPVKSLKSSEPSSVCLQDECSQNASTSAVQCINIIHGCDDLNKNHLSDLKTTETFPSGCHLPDLKATQIFPHSITGCKLNDHCCKCSSVDTVYNVIKSHDHTTNSNPDINITVRSHGGNRRSDVCSSDKQNMGNSNNNTIVNTEMRYHDCNSNFCFDVDGVIRQGDGSVNNDHDGDHTVRQGQVSDHQTIQASDHTIHLASNQTTHQASNHTAHQARDHTIQQASNQTTHQARDHTINQASNHTICQANDHTIQQASNHTIQQARDHTFHQANDHTIQQARDHTIHQANDHTIQQASDHTTHQASDNTSHQASNHQDNLMFVTDNNNIKSYPVSYKLFPDQTESYRSFNVDTIQRSGSRTPFSNVATMPGAHGIDFSGDISHDTIIFI